MRIAVMGRRVAMMSALMTPALASHPAFAQDATVAPAETAKADGPMTDIVVTAQKRSESAQKVPVTITAFSGQGLTDRGIANTKDLQQFTPGLQFSQNAVFGQPYIRGIGSNQLNIGSDPDVATIIDGIYIARPVGSVQNFLDVDHVEVLKGPQGTLYGRNATGGVISIVSKPPTDYWTGEIETGIGNYTDLTSHAAIGGPIVKDRVLMRIAIGGESRDGFFYNVFDKSRIDNLGVLQGRATIDILPADGWRIRLSGDFLRERDTRGLAAYVTAPGPATLVYGQSILSSPFVADINAPLGNRIDARGGSATIDKDFGGIALTSISGYRYSAYSSRLDLDFTRFNLADNEPQTETSKTFTQELRLASPTGNRLSWIAGLYYLNENATTSNNYTFYQSNSILDIAGAARTSAYAAFGQLTYRLTAKLKLTAGGRYSDEKRSVNVSSRTTATSTFAGSAKYNAFTPKFGVEYTPSRDVMLYASATRGFKSGGFNATSTTNPPFLPEYVWSYEAGFKTELLNRHLRLNGSAFYMDYSNLQVIVGVPGRPSTITNAASARIKGAEFEAQAVLGRGFTANAGLSLLDAKYRNYQSVDSERPALGIIDLAGFTLPRSPKTTLTTGLAYDRSFEAGRLAARVDYSYSSKIYFVPFDTPLQTQNGYSLVNARLSFSPAGTRLTVSGYVRNLFDTRYNQLLLSNRGFYGTIAFPGAPRTYGMTIGYKF